LSKEKAQSREVRFQQDFYFLLRTVVQNTPEIAGFRFSRVEMEWPADSGEADIVIFDGAGKEFIVVETKRKNGRVSKNLDPLNFRVIQQAFGYADILGATYVATANVAFLASFIKPSRGEPFSIERHRVLITPITILNQEFARRFLETIVQYHQATTLEEKAKLTTGLDWTFVFRLRSFVLWLATEVEPILKSRLQLDKAFKERVTEFALEKGATLSPRMLAEQMSYILTNKIVFYKVLERHYSTLPRLLDIKEERPQLFLNALNRLFDQAIQTTKDFEAVFRTGLFDDIVLPESPVTLLDVIDGLRIFIKDMATYPLEKLNADVIGHVYEQLLPDEERHRLGQFYTPPAIAEMICNWAIRRPSDTILDPAVGSGTFIIKAYQRLRILKGSRSVDSIHEENIKQLYAIDINPFPAQLTAMNLAMRNVSHPVSELNILREDFFRIAPNQAVLSPYSMKTLQGERYREIRVPEVNAVVANPPYTRWTELTKSAREAILKSIAPELTKLKVRAGTTQSEPMIYLHFVIHAAHFLRNGDRVSMIISNSWLQTDYGIRFGKYLLDNFRIAGIIDFSSRVFTLPIVATLVIFLERDSNQTARDENRVTFLFIKERNQLKPEMLLDALEKPTEYVDQFFVNTIPQKVLNSGTKWLNVLFGAQEILEKVAQASKTVACDKVFTPMRSNTGWAYWALKHGNRPDLGAKQFFYVTKEDVAPKGLQRQVHRALPSVRYAKFYSFGEDDWKQIADKGAQAYFFM
jgi:type I restriction-modification system DNA methylase subunit